MVAAIEGIITQKEPTFCIMKTNSGLSYALHISLFTSAKLENGQKVELLCTQLFKEDSQKLYAFLDKNEQKMFELLLKVNGIGANTAMSICSSLSVNDFYKALNLADENAFKKVPGIGLKSAKRIIIELSDKKINANLENNEQNQALAALLSLGFKQEKALAALAKCQCQNTSELVKEALKQLG